MFFWFGWGTKSLTWSLPDEKQLFCRFRYFHIFFCPAVTQANWYILGDSRAQDREITYDEVKRLFPQNPPHIGHWQRCGLGYLGAAMTLLVLYSFLAP